MGCVAKYRHGPRKEQSALGIAETFALRDARRKGRSRLAPTTARACTGVDASKRRLDVVSVRWAKKQWYTVFSTPWRGSVQSGYER